MNSFRLSTPSLMGKAIGMGLCLMLQTNIGCSENNNGRTSNLTNDPMSGQDASASDFDGWNEDNSSAFEDGLGLVSPRDRPCTQKIAKDYELLIAVRLIGGPRNGQRVFGGVRMSKIRPSGDEKIPVNPADTILCYDGREWQFDYGSFIDFKNLDLPRFIGMGGDVNRRFGINAGYDQNSFDDLGKKFRLLGKDYFSYADQDTKTKGMGKVDFRLRVLSTASNPIPSVPPQVLPRPSPCGPSPRSSRDCPSAPTPTPPQAPSDNRQIEESPQCTNSSGDRVACSPTELPSVEIDPKSQGNPDSGINWGSDWLPLVAPEDNPCMVNLINKKYPLLFKVEVVSGSKSSKIFIGGMRATRPEIAEKSFVTVEKNDTAFCYSGQEWQLGPGAQLEFNGSNLVRLITEGGDQQHRFGMNSGFGRDQFGGSEEAFIRAGEDYFGYLNAWTFVDGAGRIEYRWNEISPSAPVLPPTPLPSDDPARRCLALVQFDLNDRYPTLGWNGPAFIDGNLFATCRNSNMHPCDVLLKFATSCYGTRDGVCTDCYEILAAGKGINPAHVIQCSGMYKMCQSGAR